MLLAACSALLAAAALPPPPPAEKQGIQYGPMFVYLKLSPGETGRQTFTLKNFSSRAVHLGIFRRDAWHDEQGGRLFPESGSVARGLGKWLSPPKSDRIRLAGHGEVNLDQAVTVPAGALPGTFLGALMVRLETYEDEAGQEESAARIHAGVKANSVVALLFHVDVKRPDGVLPAPEVEIVGQEVQPPTESTPLKVRLRLLNKSVWEVKPVGTLAVFDAEGRPAGKAAFDPLSIWPGQPLWVTANFTEILEPGKYRAFAAFSLEDPGDAQVIYPGPPVNRKLEFEVKPRESIPPRGAEPVRAGSKPDKQGT